MKKLPTFLIIMSGFLLFQGCATIFGSRTNKLVFTGDNAIKAEVFIDDTLRGNAPGEIVLPHHLIQHGSMLEIRAEGYPDQEYRILRKPHPGYVIADFIVGGVPLIIDVGTGNIFRPSPRKFELDYSKQD